MAFDNFHSILKKVRERYPVFSKRLSEARALARWEIAVGPLIAKHSRALRVADNVLWVEVDHPIWKSELHHRKRQILEILNKTDDPEDPYAARRGPSSGAKAKRGSAPKLSKALLPKAGPIQPTEQGKKIILEDILFLDPRERRPATGR